MKRVLLRLREEKGRAFAVVFIAGIFLLSAVLPLVSVQGIPLCFFRQVTGWDCPGCGLTRAFILIFHGDFRQAIACNALAPILLLWLLLYALRHVYILWLRKIPAWFTPRGNAVIARWFLVLFLAQWVS